MSFGYAPPLPAAIPPALAFVPPQPVLLLTTPPLPLIWGVPPLPSFCCVPEDSAGPQPRNVNARTRTENVAVDLMRGSPGDVWSASIHGRHGVLVTLSMTTPWLGTAAAVKES
jgi:hypothetical protein